MLNENTLEFPISFFMVSPLDALLESPNSPRRRTKSHHRADTTQARPRVEIDRQHNLYLYLPPDLASSLVGSQESQLARHSGWKEGEVRTFGTGEAAGTEGRQRGARPKHPAAAGEASRGS